MTNVWCVRADGGRYTEACVRGGYSGVGWSEITRSLADVRSRDELYPIVREAYPEQPSPIIIGRYVGQLTRFLLEIEAGDYVITPGLDSERLCYGRVKAGPSYHYLEAPADGCPYRHRRCVEWSKVSLRRGTLSYPLQKTLSSLLTVFAVSQREEFLAAIGEVDPSPRARIDYDAYRVVLEQVLELTAGEFEILVGHLLVALGFEGTEVVGKSGDGGVDAIGELNAAGLARIKLFVQAKRYQLSARIPASTVRHLRQAIPFGGQGAFITTAEFQPAATEVAAEAGFPRIGLVNGRQLVDLLIERWSDIPNDFRDKLGLRPGLVRA